MNRIRKCGQAPGTLEYIGTRMHEEVRLQRISYGNAFCIEDREITVDDLVPPESQEDKIWLNVEGLHDLNIIRRIGEVYDIHALVLEDILNTEQRPKVDVHDHYIFINLKMLNYNPGRDMFEAEHLGLIFGKNFIISFQEEAGDDFNIVRQQLREKGPICNMEPAYLAYALMDVIVDSYFYAMERMGEWIEDKEDLIVKHPKKRRALEINQLKRDLNFLRRHIWPVREVIHTIQRRQNNFISKETSIFLSDLYDHIIQVIDSIETYRDMVASLHDLYLTNLSYRMNDVMKTLTIISTIFIPLTFISSLYGMNFHYMPELEFKFGYPAVLVLMIIVGMSLVMFFKRKGWL